MAGFLKWILIGLILSIAIEAKDLGIFGATSYIAEEDLILFIKRRIDSLDEEAQKLMYGIQKSLTSQLKQTMEIKEIKKVIIDSTTYFDPSITVDQDILNHEGQVVVKKGTQFNPLSQISLNQDLLFFDSTDQEQLEWAQSFGDSPKWILVKGKPFELEEEFKRPVYFDQGGTLTKKFGIQQVPARVSQEGSKLKIEFISLGDKHD